MIIALVAAVASLSVGFAAFSATLNISSSASVSPNSSSFSVKFSTSKDSLVVGEVSPSGNGYNLTTTNGIIDNSSTPTLTNLSVVFTTPGQAVVYTVYARNEGEYTAYLNSVNFIGEKVCAVGVGTSENLVQNACDDINIYVIIDDTLYDETSSITGRSLASGSGEKINIVLEYKGNDYVDGPMTISFPNVSLVYSTIDDPSVQPSINEKLVRVVSGDLNTVGSVVAIGDEQFYVIGQESGNVKLLAMYNLHVGNLVNEYDGAMPLERPTGIQSKSALGWNYNPNTEETNFPYVGTIAFGSCAMGVCDENYVDDSVVAYRDYLESLGANIAEVRLVTDTELVDLGCVKDDVCTEIWLYSTSYWTGSIDDFMHIWAVNNVGAFYKTLSSIDDIFGVRPVIEISLSEFE